MRRLTFGSLFSGVGGIDLGFTRAGLECRWQVEIGPYATRVLERHWPSVRRHDDVRTFRPEPIDDWRVDVICGGFPCQDISNAGKRAGIEGPQSGLWSEFARVLGVLRPRFALVENTGSLRSRGLPRVLGDLAALGYDAEWSVVSCCSLGAPHVRKRLFILAHAERPQWGELWRLQPEAVREAARHVCQWPGGPEPVRVADGVPGRVDRRRCLGNAVSPQVAELIGRRLVYANAINERAKRKGCNYKITAEKVRAKAPPEAAAPAHSNSAPAPRGAEGHLLSGLRSFVQLVGKDAARPLLNDLVNRL
jgi:DNA (cytosine-5)-methyltransferase 1